MATTTQPQHKPRQINLAAQRAQHATTEDRLAAFREAREKRKQVVWSSLTSNTRRPSQVVIDKEKKTDYWKDLQRTLTEQGAKISGEDLNLVISRAMAFGIVGDKKQRESLNAPQYNELLETLKTQLEQKFVELNGGKQGNLDSLVPSNASMIDKILSLERALRTLETRKSQEEEEEKKNVFKTKLMK